jgi:cell division transport system permease protein
MKTLTAKRVIKSGFTNFFRNIWVSIAATSMVVITLFIISTIIILYALAVLSINNSKDKVGVVTAYFTDTTTDKEMANIKAEVEALPDVKQVDFVSNTEAERRFLEIHKNDPTWIQSLAEFDKPVPASLSIKANDLNNYSSIYTTLKSSRFSPYFQKVSDTQIVIDKLRRIIDFITKFGAVLAAIFMVVTIMVTFNTIRLTIYNRKDEVEIMRLVGATNWYIRWPFIIEGIMYAVFATLVTSLLIFGLLYLLSSRIEQFLSLNSLGTSLINALFWQILLVNVVASIGLSVVASTIAIRRYLRI